MKEFKQKHTQNGLRVFLITLLVLIGLITVNLLFSLLPVSVTELDLSADKMYSVSDATKRSLSKLTNDVEIYYLSAGGESSLVDEALHTKIFLSKLPDFSRHISFRVIDTTLQPTFSNSVGITQEIANNSIIVKSASRTRVIEQDDLFYYYMDGIGKMTTAEAQQYVYMFQAYYGQTVTPAYQFDGEGQLLSAISYVTSNELPVVYTLDGHSELTLSESLLSALSLQNMEVSSLTLMKTGTIPEDCSLLIINCPQADLSDAEAKLIFDYLKNGGKMLLITIPGISGFGNLMALTAQYGLSMNDGILVEENGNHYYQQPYYLFPSVSSSHAVTAEYANSSYILLPSAHGIEIADTLPDGVTATAIFSTSNNAYLVDIHAETIELPEGQTPTTHHVGVVAEDENGSEIVWISSFGVTDDTASSYTAGGNQIYFLSAVRWLCDAQEGLSVTTPLTLSTPKLTITSASAGLWAILLIFLIPLSIFIVGLVYWMKRRKK